MDTLPPTPSSPREPKPPELEELHEDLRKNSIDPDRLAVLSIGQNEMIFGEVQGDDYFYEGEPAGLLGDLLVAVKNPKRLVRFTGPGQAPGSVMSSLLLFNYDLIQQGVIEVQASAGFWLQWLDYPSQVAYCRLLSRWLQDQRKAKSGLHLPDGPLVKER